MAVKSFNNISNTEPNDPRGFKEVLKIKYDSILAMVRMFPNGTGLMLHLLQAETIPLNWADYCAMLVAEQTTLEDKGDGSTKAMLLLLNSKNNSVKKDLRLLYSQGNKSA